MSSVVLLVTTSPLWSLTTLSCVLGIPSQTELPENQLWSPTGVRPKPPSKQTVSKSVSTDKAYNHPRGVSSDREAPHVH